MTTAIAYMFNPDTRQHDKPVTYEARTEMEAIRWINFNKDSMVGGRILKDGE